VLLLAFAALCWYAFMAVHESGHVLAAWVSGGSVERVVLHPLQFSRTDLAGGPDGNPHPVFVALAGAVWGCVLPLGAWLVARGLKWKYDYLLRAFAGFCLVANGAYLGAAFILPVGDAEDLIRLGVPVWAFAVPGIVVFGAGLWVWDGLSERFIGTETA
jgi:hypothetical protein